MSLQDASTPPIEDSFFPSDAKEITPEDGLFLASEGEDSAEREKASDNHKEEGPREKKGRTNRRLRKDDDHNFVPTNPWGTEALLAVEQFDGSILEPACGDGAISKVLEDFGYDVVSTDLIDRGYGVSGQDFFKRKDPAVNIVTNPPYGSGRIADRFVIHALSLASGKIAMLLRLSFLEGVWRRENIYNRFPLSRVWIFSERLTLWWPDRKPKDDGEKESGGTTAYAWFIWDCSPGAVIPPFPEIRFLPIGFKKRAADREKALKKEMENKYLGQGSLF